MACPRDAVAYNGTLCPCNPGYLLNRTTGGCDLFRANGTILKSSGLDSSGLRLFSETIFSLDSIKKFNQPQAVFLEATVVLLLSCLLFCFFLQFMKLRDGRSLWFRMRWLISRLDVCFVTRHWLDDLKVVKKRKTELGGTCSIATWILFSGLLLCCSTKQLRRGTSRFTTRGQQMHLICSHS